MPRRLLEPSSLVVVGASTNPEKAGYSLFENAARFEGEMSGIGRRRTTLHGRDILDRLDQLGHAPDLAVLAIPPEPAVEAVAELGRAGVGAAIVCAGGFAESGPEGAELQRRLAEVASANGIRVLGPNTSGVVVPGRQLYCSFVPAVRGIRAGSLGIVAQSGGVAHSTAFAASNEGVGVSAMVGVGNGADLRLPELVELVADLADTAVLAVHVEGIDDGRALLDVIDRCHHRTPVIVLKAGRSDVDRIAASHTGALTGDWATASAMLSEAGAVVVETQSDLVDAAKALSSGRLPPSSHPGVGVVTGQAGPGLLLVDQLQELGVDVPALDEETVTELESVVGGITHVRNPVDTGRPGPAFLQAAEIVGGSELIDLLAVFALVEPGAIDLPTVAEKLSSHSMPTLLGTGGPREELDELRARVPAGFPVYESPDRLARGVWALCRDAEMRALVRSQPSPATRLASDVALPALPASEFAVKEVLAAVGIPSPARVECRSRDDALAALRRLATPVAVKIADAAITHKSRAGGVHLDVRDAGELERALDLIDRVSGASDAGYLVEEMVGAGIDLIIGARSDPSWGTVIVVGDGGVATEELGRIRLHRAPVSAERLADGLERTGSGGGQISDELVGRIATVANTLAALLDEWPAADTIEINPLRIVDGDLVALDALVVTKGLP